MSSTSILSRPTGPRELLTMFAMANAAVTEIIRKKEREMEGLEQKNIPTRSLE